jgi:hypothetical protein
MSVSLLPEKRGIRGKSWRRAYEARRCALFLLHEENAQFEPVMLRKNLSHTISSTTSQNQRKAR